MRYYRKKPVTVAVVCYNGKNLKEIEEMSENVRLILSNGILSLDTLEGPMRVNVGDYIIRGVHGEIYPCKPDIFHETYEEASLNRTSIDPGTSLNCLKEGAYGETKRKPEAHHLL